MRNTCVQSRHRHSVNEAQLVCKNNMKEGKESEEESGDIIRESNHRK